MFEINNIDIFFRYKKYNLVFKSIVSKSLKI